METNSRKDHSVSHAKALELASAMAVRATIDRVQRAREQMIAELAEQKQMIEATSTFSLTSKIKTLALKCPISPAQCSENTLQTSF
jgi:hypothetical protein